MASQQFECEILDDDDDQEFPTASLVTPRSRKSKSRTSNSEAPPKQKSWTVSEDENLVKSWSVVSRDPIVGINQQGGTLWGKVMEEFYGREKQSWERVHDQDEPFVFLRTVESMRGRWNGIKKQVGHFVSAMAKTECVSGANLQDKMNLARQLYTRAGHGKFNVDHCYTLLHEDAKFNDDMVVRNFDKSSSSQLRGEEPPVGDFKEMKKMPITREIGNKKAKALAKQAQGNIVLQELLAQMKSDNIAQHKIEEDDLQHRREELQHRKLELQAKQALANQREATRMFDAEARLMTTDVSLLPESERNTINAKKQSIQAKWNAANFGNYGAPNANPTYFMQGGYAPAGFPTPGGYPHARSSSHGNMGMHNGFPGYASQGGSSGQTVNFQNWGWNPPPGFTPNTDEAPKE